MNKSTCDEANDASRVISRLDVGRRVLVNGHFGGTLKYVGKIIDKNGFFCGIELDQPIGKHDGTYRNIAYFECREGHGIFAPTYKVQLEDESNNLDKVASRQRPSKLTRSAIPAFFTHNRKHRKPSETGSKLSSYNDASFINNNNGAMTINGLSDGGPLMNCSLMSTGSSSCMDNSFFSTSTTSSGNSNVVGYGDDLMMNSNHTYIVTDSDCMLLNDIEINDSNLLIFDESDDDGCPRSNSRDYSSRSNPSILPDVAITTSIILERPSVDVTLLPVVSSGNNSASGTVTVSEAEDNDVEDEDDDVATPMVDGSCRQFPHPTTNNNDGVGGLEATTMYVDERSTQMRNSATFTTLNGRPVIPNSETVTFNTTTTANNTTGNTAELNKFIDQESERLMDAMNHNKRENTVCINKVIIDEDDVNGNNNDRNNNNKKAKIPATKSPAPKHSDSSTTRNRKSETTEKSTTTTTTKITTGKKLDTPTTKNAATVKHSDKAKATSPTDTANKPERPPKKPRMSIREMLQQSVPPPAATRPPKAPSKNQLMMERMKASIEAEKHKAKKEVKSKLSEILHSDNTNSIADEKPAQGDNAESEPAVIEEDHAIDEQENMTINVGVAVKSTTANSHISMSNVAQHQNRTRVETTVGGGLEAKPPQNKAKTLTNGSSVGVLPPTSKSATTLKNDGKDAALPSLKRLPLKARQNIPPPSATSSATNNCVQSGASKQRGVLNQHRKAIESSSLKPNAAIKRTIPPLSTHFANNNSTTSHLARYARPISGCGGGGGVDRRGPSIDAKKRCPPTSVSASSSSVASSAKDASVKSATTFRPSTTLSAKATSAIDAKKKVIEELRRESNRLRSQLCWNAKALDVLAIVHRWMDGQGEEAERRHVGELERVRAEHTVVIDSIKQRCESLEAERETLGKRCDELEVLCAEEKARCETLEQANVDIAAELAEFEVAMAKNEDENTKKLLGDLSSMKFDVEQKSLMLRELRSQNHQLQFIVDTIPGKDTELQKLTHRCDELSTELTHQHLLQKQLVQQLEECRREARCATQHVANVEKENDILRYEVEQLREQQPAGPLASPHSSWNKSLNCTSTPLSSRVNGRNTSGSAERPQTGDRPHSTSAYANPSLFQTPPRGVMCKSLDSSAVERSLLSIYQEQGRQNRQLNTPSKIYTPNGTFEVNESTLSSETNNNAKVSSSEDVNNSSSFLDTGNEVVSPLNSTRRIDFNVSEDDVSGQLEFPSMKNPVEEVF